MRYRTWAYALAFLLAAVGRPALAIIVVTDNPAIPSGGPPFLVSQVLTTDPGYTGSTFAGSGSQFEGQLIIPGSGDGGGTAIAPSWFLTTQHLVANPASTFVSNGTTYSLTGNSFNVGNGMTIYQVNGTFGTFASIVPNDFNGLNGAVTSSFGYGDAPNLNAPVTGPTGQLQGYQWLDGFNKLSWGPSSVLGYTTVDQAGNTAIVGAFRPDLGVGNASSTLASQDSGGGVFVQDTSTGVWKLAAVNFAVNGPYFPTPNPAAGGDFNAALWDQSGFFASDGSAFTGPQDWFANNISTAVFTAIQADIASVPELAALPLLASGAALMAVVRRRRRRRPNP